MRNRFIIIVFCLISIVVFSWVMSRSTVEIIIRNHNPKNFADVTIISETGQERKYKTKEGVFKKVVKNGNYGVFVAEENKTFFAQVHGKGFLRTYRLSRPLVQESKRTVVADSPKPCHIYLATRAYSQECTDLMSSMQEHLPASGSLPTYVNSVPTNNLTGELRGLVTIDNGNIVALIEETTGGAGGYYVQQIRPGLVGSERIKISYPNDTNDYSMARYGSGFVVFNDNYTIVKAFDPLGSSPTKISLPKSDNKELRRLSVNFSASNITQVFSKPTHGEEGNVSDIDSTAKSVNETTQVIVSSSNKDVVYTFGTQFIKVSVCGSERLCALHPEGLDVYSTSGDNPTKAYFIPGIKDFFDTSDGNVKFVSREGILDLNTPDGTGHLEYSFQGMNMCGLGESDDGYLLCLVDERLGKIGVLISPKDADNSDQMDKKTLKLARAKSVNHVSVNHNYIYVLPTYASLESSSLPRSISINKSQKNKIDQDIASQIRSLRFNKDVIVKNIGEL